MATNGTDAKKALLFLRIVLQACIKIAICVIIVAVFYYGIKRAYAFGYSIFTTGTADEAPGRDVEVTILNGMEPADVATLLHTQGLILDEEVFLAQEIIYGYDILPGTYKLNTSWKIVEMLEVMSYVEPESETAQTTVAPTTAEQTMAAQTVAAD